jgi:hypothetical protein
MAMALHYREPLPYPHKKTAGLSAVFIQQANQVRK